MCELPYNYSYKFQHNSSNDLHTQFTFFLTKFKTNHLIKIKLGEFKHEPNKISCELPDNLISKASFILSEDKTSFTQHKVKINFENENIYTKLFNELCSRTIINVDSFFNILKKNNLPLIMRISIYGEKVPCEIFSPYIYREEKQDVDYLKLVKELNEIKMLNVVESTNYLSKSKKKIKLLNLNMYPECIRKSFISDKVEIPNSLKFEVDCLYIRNDDTYRKIITILYINKDKFIK